MSVEITMPKLSDTMEEGTIIRWGVKVGDRVAKGDVVAEVETDKAAMEMEAFEEGFVSEILVKEGETVAVGTVIAVLIGGAVEKGKDEAEKKAEEKEPVPQTARDETTEVVVEKPKKEPSPKASEESGRPREEEPHSEDHEDQRVAVSPAARKLAEERRIALSGLQGTGPGGRIVLADVEKKISAGQEGGEVSAGAEEKPRKTPPAPVDSKAQRIRRVVARKMEESWKNIPHFYVTVAVDVGDVLRFHQDLKVSLNDFILAAVGRALRDHPRVNSLWKEGEAVPMKEINVAFAAATDQGLYSPVVRNCDRLSLRDVHQRSRELLKKIKAGTISGEELEGATFTVSNMGMLGVESFSAIITPPQAGALAVGAAAAETMVADNGELEVVKRLRLTLSADHRVMDGAEGAAFLKSVKNYLEAPLQLIVNIE